MERKLRFEIVHLAIDTLIGDSQTGGRRGKKANRMLKLIEEHPRDVHFISEPAQQIDLSVPKNTQIILCGGAKESCVKVRQQILNDAGYKNNRIRPALTYTRLDIFPNKRRYTHHPPRGVE